VTFASVFYIGGYAGCYVGGLSELSQMYDLHKWLNLICIRDTIDQFI